MATVNGIWVFNETLTLPTFENLWFSVNFTSSYWNGTELVVENGIQIGINVNSSTILRAMFYGGRWSTNYYTDSNGWSSRDGSGSITIYSYESIGISSLPSRTFDFGSTEQEVPDEFYTWLTTNAVQKPVNIQIEITEPGTTTLATKGKYCDRNIDVNVDKVYDAGMSKAESDFWNAFHCNGTRTFYEGAFRAWGIEYIRPNIKITPVGCREFYIFEANKDLKKVESQYFDFSQVRMSDTVSVCHECTFRSCSNLEEVEDCGWLPGAYYQTFSGCPKLRKIGVVRVNEESVIHSAFTGCNDLEDVTFEGPIGQNGLNMSACAKLTHDSLMSIINALATKTEGTWSVTLGTTNLAKLTDAEKAIATEKGWTLA